MNPPAIQPETVDDFRSAIDANDTARANTILSNLTPSEQKALFKANSYLFLRAIKIGAFEIAKMMVRQQNFPTELLKKTYDSGHTALSLACQEKHTPPDTELLTAMIKKGSDVRRFFGIDNESILQMAVSNTKHWKALLQFFADYFRKTPTLTSDNKEFNRRMPHNEDNSTALHTATNFFSDPTIVQFLCDLGFDVNAQDKDGDTPLHIACNWDKYDMVKILLEHGANPDILNHKRQLPKSMNHKVKALLPKSVTRNSNGIVNITLGARITRSKYSELMAGASSPAAGNSRSHRTPIKLQTSPRTPSRTPGSGSQKRRSKTARIILDAPEPPSFLPVSSSAAPEASSSPDSSSAVSSSPVVTPSAVNSSPILVSSPVLASPPVSLPSPTTAAAASPSIGASSHPTDREVAAEPITAAVHLSSPSVPTPVLQISSLPVTVGSAISVFVPATNDDDDILYDLNK